MDSSSSHPRRSPRLTNLARVRELIETDAEKERRLRRAQYREKQDSIAEGERQERNERRRAAYQARISAANRQPDDRETSCKLTEVNGISLVNVPAFNPMFTFERIAKICKALPERRQEEKRLQESSQHYKSLKFVRFRPDSGDK